MKKVTGIFWAAAVLAIAAQAQGGEFQNTASGFWHDSAIWTLTSGVDAGGDGVPSAGDNATIIPATLVEMHAPHTAGNVTVQGTLRGSTNAAIFDLTQTFTNLTIANGGVLEVADGREAELVTVLVTNDFTIQSGGLLRGAAFGNASTPTLEVQGNYTDQVTSGFSALGGASTTWKIKFSGTNPATMQMQAGASSDFGNIEIASNKVLTISSPRPVYLTGGSDFLVNTAGTVKLDNGSFFFGFGTFTLSSGATLGVAAPVGVTRSALFQIGSSTLPNNANYLFYGVGGQNTGPDLPTQVNSLTIDTPDWVTLSQNVSVTDTLTLKSGRVDTGAFTVFTHSDEAKTVRTTGWVNGNLARTVDASVTGPRTLHLGTATAYSPVVVDITSAGTGFGFLTATAVDGAHTPAPSQPAIPRYWTIDGSAFSGFQATLTFEYAAGDVGALNENNFAAARFTGPTTFTILPGQTANAALNRVAVTGVTGFSDWLIVESSAAVPEWIQY